MGHAPPEPDDVARRTHPRTILANVFTTIIAGLYFAFRIAVDVNPGASGKRGSSGFGPGWWIFLAVVPFVVVHFVIELLRWRAFTFRVGPHRLVIDKGIFTRHHIVVPYDRVQQVDVNRRLTALILGLATVRIDTAGMGAHTSVHLKYLDPRSANGLRAFILAHRDQRAAEASAGAAAGAVGPGGAGVPTGVPWAGAPVAPPPVEQPVLSLGPARLAVAAITHHSVLVTVPVVLAGTLWVLAVMSLSSRKPLDAAAFGIAAIGFAGFLVLTAVQALIGVLVKQWGFQLTHTGDDVHLRFGLTDQRHLTVPRRRIQHVEVVDNPVRRALGLVSVHLHSAASVTGAGEGQAATRFEIPVVRRAELDVLLPLLLGDPAWRVPALTPRPPAARRRAITRRVAVLVVAVAFPAIAFAPAGLALLVVPLLGIPWGLEAHRRAGCARTSSVVVLGHGVLHHRIVLVPVDRIQSQRTTSSPFQRLAGTKTLHIDVARATLAPSLYDVAADMPLGA